MTKHVQSVNAARPVDPVIATATSTESFAESNQRRSLFFQKRNTKLSFRSPNHREIRVLRSSKTNTSITASVSIWKKLLLGSHSQTNRYGTICYSKLLKINLSFGMPSLPLVRSAGRRGCLERSKCRRWEFNDSLRCSREAMPRLLVNNTTNLLCNNMTNLSLVRRSRYQCIQR